MIEIGKFVEDLVKIAQHNELWAPVGVVVLVAGIIGFWLGHFYQLIKSRHSPEIKQIIFDYDKKLDECNAKLEKALDKEKTYSTLNDAVFAEESDLWEIYPPQPFAGYSAPIHISRPKIIVVANNKGGVGKTTLTAALAAYFERRVNKRVLLIDLDYQGSLSAWMIQAAGLIIPESQDFRLALANSLIDGTALNNWQPIVLGSHSIGTDSLQRTHMITSNYTLTQHEMKLMLRWLALGGKPDVRYHIAEALLSNHVQDQRLGYDIVLIDAPPRLSTSTIGALAAATHLVMPTVLDRLSAETAGGFLRQVWELRAKLNLGLELAGVVGTKTPARPLENKLPPIQEEALATVISGLAQWRTNGYVFKRDIQLLASVTRCAGVSNPYFAKEDKAQRMFESFGDELSERIGL